MIDKNIIINDICRFPEKQVHFFKVKITLNFTYFEGVHSCKTHTYEVK